jgi:hypothetical protein
MPRIITANSTYPDPDFVSDTLPPYGAAQDPIVPKYRLVAKELVKSGTMFGTDALEEGEYLGEDFNEGPALGTKALIPGQSITILDELIEGDADVPARSVVDPLATVLGLPGLMDVPIISRVDPLATLRGINGTMNVPALSDVLARATLRGVAGTGPTNDQIIVAGSGNYVVTATFNVKKDVAFGPNESLLGTLKSGGGTMFTATIPGVTGTVTVVSITVYNGDTTILYITQDGKLMSKVGESIQELASNVGGL